LNYTRRSETARLADQVPATPIAAAALVGRTTGDH
jgi:hypothetical protein